MASPLCHAHPMAFPARIERAERQVSGKALTEDVPTMDNE